MTRPSPGPAEYARMSELVEQIETAQRELHALIYRHFPGTSVEQHKARRLAELLADVKNVLDDAASRDVLDHGWSPGLFYGSTPDVRAGARAELNGATV